MCDACLETDDRRPGISRRAFLRSLSLGLSGAWLVSSGRSLAAAFTEDGTVTHDYLWWSHEGNRAIRVGDWKLVAAADSKWELYNLAKDRTETNNLADSNPEKVVELRTAWEARNREFAELAKETESN